VYGLNNLVRNTYRTLATVICIKQVLSPACQIGFARAADIFCGPIILVVVTIFYVFRTIIRSKSYNNLSYSIGSCIYAISYTSIILIYEVYVVDFSNINFRGDAGT